jgi:arsenate reductase
VEYLKTKGVDFQIRHYLEIPFSAMELKALIAKTKMRPEEIVRKEEEYYKQNLKGKTLTDDEWIAEMIKEPRLIQRPIVERGDEAVLARPTEEIDKLIG